MFGCVCNAHFRGIVGEHFRAVNVCSAMIALEDIQDGIIVGARYPRRYIGHKCSMRQEMHSTVVLGKFSKKWESISDLCQNVLPATDVLLCVDHLTRYVQTTALVAATAAVTTGLGMLSMTPSGSLRHPQTRGLTELPTNMLTNMLCMYVRHFRLQEVRCCTTDHS